MDALTAACAAVVALALAWSAGAKLGRPAALAVAMDELRLPASWSRPLATRMLPSTEALLALALVLLPASWELVAVAAVVTGLMATYTAIIGRALTFDPRPRCGCFGEANLGPVGPLTLARNLALLACSGFVLIRALAGHSPIGAVGRGGWLAVLVLVAALWALGIWQFLRRPRVTPATVLPGGLVDAAGTLHSWQQLAGDRWRTHLLVINCTCAAASRAVKSLAHWRDHLDGDLVPVSLLDLGQAERSFPLPAPQHWWQASADWPLELPADEPALVVVDADGVVLRSSFGLDAIGRELR